MKYLAFIFKSEDGLYTGIVPDADYATDQGDTFEDCLQRLPAVVEAHLHDRQIPPTHDFAWFTPDKLQELDIPLDATPHYIDVTVKEVSKKFMISMPESLLTKIDAIVKSSGETRSGFLQQAARERLSHA